MFPSVVAWVLSGFLALSSLSLAFSAWKQQVWLSGRSRMSLLVGLLEAAAVAGLFRLALPWSQGTVVLWVLAVAALAAAAAGVVIRWHELPVRSRSAEIAAPAEPAFAAAPAPGQLPAPASTPASGSKPVPASGSKAATKKPKKDPGKGAVAGHACFLAAVVALSFFVG